MTPVGFQLEFFDSPSKNEECLENKIIKVGCRLIFWKGEWMILPLSKHCLEKNADAQILPFNIELNGTD